jgi:hypothetical protein
MFLLLDINTGSGGVRVYKPHFVGYGKKKH